MNQAQTAIGWLAADWPAPTHIRAGTTLRRGGVSQPPYDSFNLALHVEDEADIVLANRAKLKNELKLPAEPFWLQQVHSVVVTDAAVHQNEVPTADASYSHQAGCVCVVMTADCLPVLITNRQGTMVAAAHAGWRGLLEGIIEATIEQAGLVPSETLVWLGPAIGPAVYEVGEDVKQTFLQQAMHDESAFTAHGPGKVLMDMYMLARQRLHSMGVDAIYGGQCCTYSQAEEFYSFRRDGRTGRMASLIWMDNQA